MPRRRTTEDRIADELTDYLEKSTDLYGSVDGRSFEDVIEILRIRSGA